MVATSAHRSDGKSMIGNAEPHQIGHNMVENNDCAAVADYSQGLHYRDF